ncbi:MAG: gfo/Idh/MocA family oxidoreductase, partial [Bacteroidota bacterium]
MKNHASNKSRRNFIKKAGSVVVGSSVGFNVLANQAPETKFSADTLKVGLIGCGGRGSGAAVQALRADDNVVLTHMCDVFEDRLQDSYKGIMGEVPDKVKVSKENMLLGFDGWRKVIDSDVGVANITTSTS